MKHNIEGKVTIKLHSSTRDPLITISDVYRKSRGLPTEGLKNSDIIDDVRMLFKTDIPLLEFVNLNWEIYHSVAFREQLVRHRMAAYWITTSRSTNLSESQFLVPPKYQSNKDAKSSYLRIMQEQLDKFNFLTSDDIKQSFPAEVARDILPLSRMHTIFMSINLRALMLMLRKRTCWIAQDIWQPILIGMKKELSRIFTIANEDLSDDIIMPPCARSHGCPFTREAQARVDGFDPLPPCPIYCKHFGNLSADTVDRDRPDIKEHFEIVKQIWPEKSVKEVEEGW